VIAQVCSPFFFCVNVCSVFLPDLGFGQILCLRGGCALTYIVVPGDTCLDIESRTGVTVAQLHALNPAINSDCTSMFPILLFVNVCSVFLPDLAFGQILCLRGGCALTYIVKDGDTCLEIESRTGVSEAQLHALNPAINSGCTSMFPILLLY
jgi:chitinase